MVNQQLIDYIKSQQHIGKSREEISAALSAQGWQHEDIEQGFLQVASGAPAPLSPAGDVKLPKAGKILDEAWNIYKASFKALIIAALIPMLATIILMAIFFGGGMAGMAVGINTKALGATGIILGIVAIIVLAYVNIWGAIAQLFVIKDRAEKIGWKEAFKRAKPKIVPFFLTALLVALAVIGGFILLIIPGIIFSIWFSQTSYVVVEENLQTRAALKRSKHYITGRLGEVLGKFFFILLLTFVVYFVVGIILGILSGSKEQTNLLSNIISIFWTPLTLAYGYQLYKHLKATRP